MQMRAALWCLSVAVIAAAAGGMAAKAHTDSSIVPTHQDSEKQLPPLIRSVDGPDLYRAYCASCHGRERQGQRARGAGDESDGTGLDGDCKK